MAINTLPASRPDSIPVSFSLWNDPWIGVLTADGDIRVVGIAECLLQAHEFRSLQENSPLVMVGIHRLLAAVAQAIVSPRRVDGVRALLDAGRFEPEGIHKFGLQYRDRFDLFSPEEPFLQTADVPLKPGKAETQKSVAYLTAEIPAGTEVDHWRHGLGSEQRFCPRCVAGGLVAIPAFATSGGAGIKPSINGVPPLYVLPTGRTLFETLAFSVVAPEFQPAVRGNEDRPAWEGPSIVPGGEEVNDVGYLESLTFPARRVRLFPRNGAGVCSRCGQPAALFVSTMLFEMGLSRPKNAPAWFDPFVAYRLRGDKPPVPIRPQAGKATWREYSTLLLTEIDDAAFKRPAVVLQIGELAGKGIDRGKTVTFRCAGMRTDMKAKIFEWTDSMLEVPLELLVDKGGAQIVRAGIEHAQKCAGDLSWTFRQSFGPDGGSRERYRAVKERMETAYWMRLEAEFRQFVLGIAARDSRDAATKAWGDAVMGIGREVFQDAAKEIGDRAADLRKRVQAERLVNMKLGHRRKEWMK